MQAGLFKQVQITTSLNAYYHLFRQMNKNPQKYWKYINTDYGSGGCGFDSCLVHTENEAVIPNKV